jgi:predicted molibdopterin-dependent oxidoreductase YjgC
MKNQLNWLKISILGSLLVVFAIGSVTAHEDELNRSKWIEKQKKVTYSYSLRPSDKININNQFGDVKMKLWQENSIKVDIIITANAPTESRAVEFLRMVEIANRYAGG